MAQQGARPSQPQARIIYPSLPPFQAATSLPSFVLQGNGTIICVGDVEAFHTGPKHGAYGPLRLLRGWAAGLLH